MHKLKSLRGFSLIEVAVVIGIVAIMAAVALPSFFQGHNQADLNGSTGQIVSALRTAQSQSASQVKGTSWGIHFVNNSASTGSGFGTYLSRVNGASGDGKITEAVGVTLDASGSIYVADYGSFRVEKYDSNGNFVRTWGWGVQTGASAFENCTSGCRDGIAGTPPGAGQFWSITGITYGGDPAYIYVSDAYSKIQKFDRNGNYIGTVGSVGPGAGAGQFNTPKGIRFDQNGGWLFVADAGNHRVDVFDSLDTFKRSFGWGVDTGASAFENCTTASTCQAGTAGSGAGQFTAPSDVAMNANNGDVYVMDSTNNNVQRFSQTSNFYNQPFMYGSTYSTGYGVGLTVDDNGNFYITASTTVQEYNASGTYVAQFGTYGTGAGQLKTPYGIAVDSMGNIYVADLQNPYISKFSGNSIAHVLVNQFLTGGTAEGQEYASTGGLTFDSSGNVYIADENDSRIQKFNASGTFITMWGYGVRTGASALETCTSGCQRGVAGAGAGQLDSPIDIAVDSSGNVYAVDVANNRVEKYSSAGAYTTQFGSTGSAENQLQLPRGMAIDASGNIYVADFGNHRVDKFSSAGAFITMWGWGVQDGASSLETCTSGCRAGLTGNGNGEFSASGGPQSIAVDSSGNVWVSDFGNRIQKFSSIGAYLGGFTPVFSAANGGVDVLNDIAFDASGNIWVADGGGFNNRVTEFNQSGTYLSHAGGGYDAIFSQGVNYYVGVNPVTGNIYVDNGGPRMYVLSGTPLYGTAGSGSSSTSTVSYFSVFTGSTYDAANVQNTYPLPASLAFVSSSVPVGTPVDVVFSAVTGATTGANIGIYNVTNPSLNSWIRINALGQITIAGSTFGTYLSKFGSSGSGNGQLATPSAVAFDSSGNIYVVDMANNRVQKFSSNGTYLSQFGSLGSGDGQFHFPEFIAIDASGNIYVTDSWNQRVEKFSSNGTYLSQFGSLGSGNGQFGDNGDHVGSTGIAIDGSGNIYVVDYGNNRVEKFNSSGVYVSQFGSTGSGTGQFTHPYGIAIDGSGNLYVVDYGNNRVEKFNSSGTYLSSIGSSGTGDGQLTNPIGVAIDSIGNLDVTDYGIHRIQKFSSSGNYLAKFGSGAGSGNGQFNYPYGIAIDGSGNLYVADQLNNRIQVFGGN